MRQILACVDFSDATDAVAREAARLAGPDGQLHLLHVAAPEPVLAGYDKDEISEHTRADRAGELLEEHQRLRELAAAVGSGMSQAPIPLVVIDGPDGVVATILHEADRVAADTIVAGTHGHGVLHRIALGSTSAALAHRARQPVLLVPVPQR